MVWRCEKRYALKYIWFGAKIRYRVSDLEAFLDEGAESGVGKSFGPVPWPCTLKKKAMTPSEKSWPRGLKGETS
jgi:hypothetical protein